MKWSMVFNFFRSLSLAHLERSLFSLSKQSVFPDEFIVFDNDTEFSSEEINGEVKRYFPNANVVLDRHADPSKRNASYAQNKSIRMANHDTFIFTKADCIYREDFCEQLIKRKSDNPMEFIAAWLYQMAYFSETGKPHDEVDHAKDLEGLSWRDDIRRLSANTVNGQLHNHATGDAPCFCTTKQAMERAGWYDEELRGWSLWQLDLQSNMQKRGVSFNIIPEVLYWHMLHKIPAEEGERDLQKAHDIFNRSSRRRDPAFR